MDSTKVVTVTTKEGFKNAIHQEFDTILVTGNFAQEIVGSMRKSNAVNMSSNLVLIAGCFFAPAFFIGLAGKMFTAKMKKYEIVEMEEDMVTIKKKKR